MKIWLVTIGEPLPSDPGHPRLLRAGLLAETLAERGHEVLWWTSAFDHVNKIFRAPADMRVRVRPRLELLLMHGTGYRRNLSLARIRDHRTLAHRFANLALREAKPDIILASFPSIELCLAAARFGRAQGVPVVLDVRDLWPDIFLDYAPAPLRSLARLALSQLFSETVEAFRLAFAVTGITPPFVQWGVQRAGRLSSALDRDFPMGYPARTPNAASLSEARRWWKEQHDIEVGEDLLVVFFGSFGRQVDLVSVLEAARRLRGTSIRFVLCGTGERLTECRHLVEGLDNVIQPGWVDAPRIRALMDMADVGLAPYFSRSDFLASYPNKVLEYLSGGLPVLSAISGLVGELVETEGCGLVYGGDSPAERLASLLNELKHNPDRLVAMSENARRLFAKRFSAEKVYADVTDYLAQVVQATSKNRSEHGLH